MKIKELVDSIFSEIKKATNIEQIDSIISGKIAINQMDQAAYPYLHFSINVGEVDQLKDIGVLDSEGNLNPDLSQSTNLTSLEKILYSVLWKNGDLKKVKHIIQGIKDANKDPRLEKQNGLVFYQFGKFLTKTGQPIIDQHVLRSFAVYASNDNNEIERWRLKSTITKNDRQLISDYIEWLKSDEISKNLRETNEYTYHIDQVLFALGKTIKKRN